MRHALALSVAPLLIRIVLGLTFLWAGMAKLTQYFEPSPEQADILRSWRVLEGGPAPEARSEARTTRDTQPEPRPETQPSPAGDPAPSPPADTAPVDEPEPESSEPDAQPVALTLQTGPAEVRGVYRIALLIHASASPADGARPLWPPALAQGSWPVILAWAAAVSELVFGGAVLLGFFARLSALPLAGTMGVAMWLTQIGPAVQSGNAFLGVLPGGVFDLGPGGYAYTMILWQFALLMASLSLLLTGPGAVSVDRMLFGAPSHSDEDDEGFDEDDEDVEFVKMPRRRADDD
ncbi:MAG: DoxX family membrane protein [Phycisphaerales bacterium]